MKVQIYSDIHIELYNTFPKIKKEADILFLAGDIGKITNNNYKDFIKYVSLNWEKVFYVLGNHEFYHNKKTYNQLLEKYINYISEFTNITLVLPKNKYYYKNYCIIGCTLWSYAKDKYTNCFENIKIYDETKRRKINITLDYYNLLHKEEKKFILDNLKDNIIILTHYPVTQHNTSHIKYIDQDQNIKNIFANNFDKEISNKNIKNCIFISGHTHYSYDFIKNNNRYISNQFGYPDELNESNMNTSGVYDI